MPDGNDNASGGTPQVATIDFSRYASGQFTPNIDFSKYVPPVQPPDEEAWKKKAAIAAGATTLSVLTGGIGGIGTQAAIQGTIGAGAGALSAAAEKQSTDEDILNSALTGGLIGASAGALGAAVPKLVGSKLGRSFINESVGATGRDVIYGNPAKALLNENIVTPTTGDIEAVKETGRLADAGGRLGSVTRKILELQPQLNAALSKSTATISMADAVDRPLMDSVSDIISNRAMTQAEKDRAISQLGDLQQALHYRLTSNNITPLQAQQMKVDIGDRVNWSGQSAVGDEVKPVYRKLYGSLKEAINAAVPEAEPLNDRLTDLHAAQKDLVNLARNEEVSRGSGPLRGTTGRDLMGAVESTVGRALPLARVAPRAVVPAVLAGVPAVVPGNEIKVIGPTSLAPTSPLTGAPVAANPFQMQGHP